jgi:hypothetical protein
MHAPSAPKLPLGGRSCRAPSRGRWRGAAHAGPAADRRGARGSRGAGAGRRPWTRAGRRRPGGFGSPGCLGQALPGSLAPVPRTRPSAPVHRASVPPVPGPGRVRETQTEARPTGEPWPPRPRRAGRRRRPAAAPPRVTAGGGARLRGEPGSAEPFDFAMPGFEARSAARARR